MSKFPVRISNQIFLLFTVAMIVFGIFAGFVYYKAAQEGINDLLERDALILSKQIADLTTVNILEQNVYNIDSVLHTVKGSNENVRYIIVLDEEGAVITSTFHHGLPKGLLRINPIQKGLERPATKSYLSNEGYIYDVIYPLDGGALGFIRLGMSSYEWGPIFRNTLTIMVCVLILSLLILLILSRTLIYNFLKPLVGLSAATKEIAKGRYDYPLPEEKGNELDGLIESMRQMMAQIESKNRRIQTLLVQTIEVQEAERLRISRELHDEVGQVLASLAMSMGLLVNSVQDEEKKAYIEEVRKETIHAIERLRSIAIDLRPPAFKDVGVEKAFSQYVKDWSEANHIPVVVEMTISEEYVSKDFHLELNLFRILQEGLTNILKHAKATEVILIIKTEAQGWSLSLGDNGLGIKQSLANRPPSYKHIGLIGMEERAERFGGYIDISEKSQWNTWIEVRIPYEEDKI